MSKIDSNLALDHNSFKGIPSTSHSTPTQSIMFLYCIFFELLKCHKISKKDITQRTLT